jgi:Tfp pilus assembly protein PilF
MAWMSTGNAIATSRSPSCPKGQAAILRTESCATHPRPLAGLDLAEMKLMKGDVDGAGEIAEAALKTDPANAEAHYVLGRID